MRIFIDSTDFANNQKGIGQGSLFRLLQDTNLAGIEVFIPQPTFWEFRESRRNTMRTALKTGKLAHINEFLAEEFTELPTEPELEKTLNTYFTNLERALSEQKAEIVPCPSIKPDELALRAIRRIAPFHNSQKGVIDYLIWRCLLDAAIGYHQHEHALITQNHRDFGCPIDSKDQQGRRTFHPDLVADLRRCGFTPERFGIFDGHKAFREYYLNPALRTKGDILSDLHKGRLTHFDHENWAREALPRLLKSRSWTSTLWMKLLRNIDVKEVLNVSLPIDIKLKRGVSRLNDGPLEVMGTATITTQVLAAPAASKSNKSEECNLLSYYDVKILVEFVLLFDALNADFASGSIQDVDIASVGPAISPLPHS